MTQLNYGTISPQKVRMYLSSRGWEKTQSESKFDVFTHKQFEDKVVVPNNKEYVDYAYRINELVNDLSLIYKEDPSRIFAGMTISSATDIIEYHYEPMNGEVG